MVAVYKYTHCRGSKKQFSTSTTQEFPSENVFKAVVENLQMSSLDWATLLDDHGNAVLKIVPKCKA